MEKKTLLNFGLINIDKPSGPTSFTVSEFVKKKLNLKKTSHMGTLDPKVTGVLPITLGRACRLSNYFIKHDKSYTGILHTHKKQEIKKLQKIISKKFIGKIKQIPPVKSAVKRAERIREVYFFDLIESSDDGKSFLFNCKVEGGTYIRKICSDLGEIINGAHMLELRRTSAGIFEENKIYNLYELEEAISEYKNGDGRKLSKMIVPAETAIKKVLPHIQVKQSAIKQLLTGKPLFKKDVIGKLPKEGDFAVFCKTRFIEIARKVKENIIVAKPVFVFN